MTTATYAHFGFVGRTSVIKQITKITLLAMALTASNQGMAQTQQVQSDTAIIQRLKQLELEMRTLQAELASLKAEKKVVNTPAPARASKIRQRHKVERYT
jgi:hypothetical protein